MLEDSKNQGIRSNLHSFKLDFSDLANKTQDHQREIMMRQIEMQHRKEPEPQTFWGGILNLFSFNGMCCSAPVDRSKK